MHEATWSGAVVVVIRTRKANRLHRVDLRCAALYDLCAGHGKQWQGRWVSQQRAGTAASPGRAGADVWTACLKWVAICWSVQNVASAAKAVFSVEPNLLPGQFCFSSSLLTALFLKTCMVVLNVCNTILLWVCTLCRGIHFGQGRRCQPFRSSRGGTRGTMRRDSVRHQLQDIFSAIGTIIVWLGKEPRKGKFDENFPDTL